jgi:hypothetical protein
MPRFVQAVALLCFFLGSPASAATLDCDQRQALRSLVKNCEGNVLYAEAGKKCLASYEAAIASAQEAVAKALRAVISAHQQAAGMENAKKGYETAVASLRALVQQGTRAQAQVGDHRNEVVLPEDFGSATAAGLPAEVFLEGQSCYSETQKLIQQYSELIGLSAKQLELTAKIAEELAQRAFRGESGLKGEDILPLLAPSRSSAGAVGKKGGPKASSGKSDITGTEKTKKK